MLYDLLMPFVLFIKCISLLVIGIHLGGIMYNIFESVASYRFCLTHRIWRLEQMYGDKHAHRHTHEHRHTREHANTQMLAVMDILVRSILHMSGK